MEHLCQARTRHGIPTVRTLCPDGRAALTRFLGENYFPCTAR